ncbi:Pterin binding enzyme [Candidatus Gugararchaeum adminiculabundum]|nr:Pterin binding enzyme [Candidatus Gugararchaeum adminiculabundum]
MSPIEGVKYKMIKGIAAFLTPTIVAANLKAEDLKGIDAVLLPGVFRGAKELEKRIGKRCVLGPLNAADLELAVRNAEKLGNEKPADKFLQKEIGAKIAGILREDGKEEFRLGNVKIGKNTRVKVIAEINDAPKMCDAELMAKAEYYVASGADILDVGAVFGEENSSEYERVFGMLKQFGKPLSIDSLNVKEINAAIEAGARLVLSVNAGNAGIVSGLPDGTGVVVIPEKPGDLKSLERNLALAEKNAGNRVRIIADPILNPAGYGFAESLCTYSEFRRKNSLPMMMGVGNLTELMNANPEGVNAVCAAFASETGVELMLTTEVAKHCAGNVRSLARAVRLMFAAKVRKQIPKSIPEEALRW